jgi:hypothetical protein
MRKERKKPRNKGYGISVIKLLQNSATADVPEAHKPVFTTAH